MKYQNGAGLPALAPACDCHVHVFDPARFPFTPTRAYTPPEASLRALEDLHRALTIDRVVLVQPSVYAHDNACLADALHRLGPARARAIAVLDRDRVGASDLARLHDAGVRGARLNLSVSGDAGARAARAVRRAGEMLVLPGWSLQVHASLELVVGLFDEFARLERPVVLDHYAGGLPAGSEGEDLLARLLAQMRRDPLYVKLSAPYRLSQGDAPGHASRLARAFVEAAPKQVLWGSDWPHTGGAGRRAGGGEPAFEPFREEDAAATLRALIDCLPDDEARLDLLVRNPARLYGFDR